MNGQRWTIVLVGSFLVIYVLLPLIWLAGYNMGWWGHSRHKLAKFLEAVEKGRTGLES